MKRLNVGDKVTWENQVGLIVKKEVKAYLCRFPQKNWPFPLEVNLSRQSLKLWRNPMKKPHTDELVGLGMVLIFAALIIMLDLGII